MANGPWISQASGDTTPLVLQSIVTGFVYAKTFTISLIDDNNVIIGPRSFVDWAPDGLQFTVSATPGGPPIFSVVGSGAGEGVTFQDAPNGIIRLKILGTKTDLLQEQNLSIAYGWLGGLDVTGALTPVFRSQCNQTFATDEVV